MDFTPGDSGFPGPPLQICAKQAKNKGQTHDWPVPAARVGRQTYAGLQFGSHYIRFIFWRAGNNFAPLPDNRGNTVVGGPYHRPPSFHGAHARKLQMLVARSRMAEPRVVG